MNRQIIIFFFIQSLPKTAYYKLIDTWLLVSLNILVVTMLFHTFLAHVVAKSTKKPIRLFSAKSVFRGGYRNKTASTSSTEAITTVDVRGPGPDTEGATYNPRPKTAMSNYGKLKENGGDVLAAARRVNDIGKVIYVVLYIMFNIVFWSVAITEYIRPAEEYINGLQEVL